MTRRGAKRIINLDQGRRYLTPNQTKSLHATQTDESVLARIGITWPKGAKAPRHQHRVADSFQISFASFHRRRRRRRVEIKIRHMSSHRGAINSKDIYVQSEPNRRRDNQG